MTGKVASHRPTHNSRVSPARHGKHANGAVRYGREPHGSQTYLAVMLKRDAEGANRRPVTRMQRTVDNSAAERQYQIVCRRHDVTNRDRPAHTRKGETAAHAINPRRQGVAKAAGKNVGRINRIPKRHNRSKHRVINRGNSTEEGGGKMPRSNVHDDLALLYPYHPTDLCESDTAPNVKP